MSKRGRPTELTPRLHELIVNMFGAGNYLDTVAAAAGIAEWTLRRWLIRGTKELERRARGKPPKPEEGIYATLTAEVRAKEANAEGRALLQVIKAGEKDWHASAWFLERKQPGKYGPRVKITLEEEFDAFFARLRRNLPADIYERVLRAVDEPEGQGRAPED